MTLKILVAEDDLLTLTMIEKVLTKEGHQVLTVQNGNDAVKSIEENDFDLVITDIQMPGIEGIEVISEIMDKKPKTKTIAISSLGRTSGYTEFLSLATTVGANGVLKKPFTPKELLETIKDIMK